MVTAQILRTLYKRSNYFLNKVLRFAGERINYFLSPFTSSVLFSQEKGDKPRNMCLYGSKAPSAWDAAAQ
jgi:hypothetical protein